MLTVSAQIREDKTSADTEPGLWLETIEELCRPGVPPATRRIGPSLGLGLGPRAGSLGPSG